MTRSQEGAVQAAQTISDEAWIKPLEWGLYGGLTAFGSTYSTRQHDDGLWSFHLTMGPEQTERFATRDEAKAAAQADYTERVLSCLTAAPFLQPSTIPAYVELMRSYVEGLYDPEDEVLCALQERLCTHRPTPAGVPVHPEQDAGFVEALHILITEGKNALTYMGNLPGAYLKLAIENAEAVLRIRQLAPTPASAPVQPEQDAGLIERLLKRAAEDQSCADNSQVIVNALAEQMRLFEKREGHNVYAVRMAVDHKNSAKRDQQYADDLKAVVDVIRSCQPAPTLAEATGREHATGDVEEIAKLVYVAMKWAAQQKGDPDKIPDWVARGNSLAQDEARRTALKISRALSTARPPVAPAPVEDWRDDPSADERWNAGLDYGMMQLCAVLGVDPKSIMWDGATETLDGDVCSAISKIMCAAYGEDWPEVTTPVSPADDTAGLREALGEVHHEMSGGILPGASRAFFDLKDRVRQALASKPAPTQNGEDA